MSLIRTPFFYHTLPSKAQTTLSPEIYHALFQLNGNIRSHVNFKKTTIATIDLALQATFYTYQKQWQHIGFIDLTDKVPKYHSKETVYLGPAASLNERIQEVFLQEILSADHLKQKLSESLPAFQARCYHCIVIFADDIAVLQNQCKRIQSACQTLIKPLIYVVTTKDRHKEMLTIGVKSIDLDIAEVFSFTEQCHHTAEFWLLFNKALQKHLTSLGELMLLSSEDKIEPQTCKIM